MRTVTCISEGRHGFVGTPSSCRRISRQRRFLHCQSSCNVDAHNSVNKTSRKGTECGNNSVSRFGQKSLWKFPRLVANTTTCCAARQEKNARGTSTKTYRPSFRPSSVLQDLEILIILFHLQRLVTTPNHPLAVNLTTRSCKAVHPLRRPYFFLHSLKRTRKELTSTPS